ncbi:serine/threonine-protein kinase [Streptomyces sp. NPDC002181]|uniref:serine/threonine-protein kinase n=1 Tax=Streptomyces sp. NPDC002181 TaxID=3364635 RepID=UPI0036C19F6D
MAQERGPGSLVGGRYRLISGSASSAHTEPVVVWEALDETLHRRMDIQEVRAPYGLTDEGRARWREGVVRRARVLAAVSSHPNIVPVADLFATDEVLWLVTEHVADRTAYEYVREHGPVPALRARRVARALIGALAAMHDVGMVHGNVTPSSVLLDDSGRAWLTGIRLSPAGSAQGSVTGVPQYMSPEQLEGREPSVESDLFALGATLHHLVQGVGPFHRDTLAATLAAVLGVSEDPPQPLRDPALAPLISGLLRRDPARRLTPGEARRLLDDLDHGYEAAARASARSTAALPQPATLASAPPDPDPAPAMTPSPGRPVPVGPFGLDLVRVLIPAVLVVWLLVAGIRTEGAPAFLAAAVPWAVFGLALALLGLEARTALRRGGRVRGTRAAAPAARVLRSVAPPAPWSAQEHRARRERAGRTVDEALLRLDRLTAEVSRGRGGDGGTDV